MGTPKRHQFGFTLVEVMLSISVATVVMGGIASAVVIATRAMPNSDSSLQQTVTAYHVTEQMAGELQCAQTVTARSATVIEFTVADRDLDASPETIRYEWSSTLGDPLLRQYNGGTAVALLDAIDNFQLTYGLQTVTDTTPGPTSDTPFFPIVELPGIIPVPLTGFDITATNWCGLYFELDPATAPADARTWTVDQITFRIKANNNGMGTGITSVQLRSADASGLPTAMILDQFTVDEDPLSNKFWTTKTWSAIASPAVSATDGICLVFNVFSGSNSGAVLFQDTTGVAAANKTSFLRSANGGATWTSSANESLTMFYVYGTVTSGGAVTTSRYFMSSVGIEMQPTASTSTRVATSVEVLNLPETTGP